MRRDDIQPPDMKWVVFWCLVVCAAGWTALGLMVFK